VPQLTHTYQKTLRYTCYNNGVLNISICTEPELKETELDKLSIRVQN